MQTDKQEKVIKDIALLRLAVLKWERLANKEESDDVVDDCALCIEYFKVSEVRDTHCIGCPIQENTDKLFCKGTPYEAWVDYGYVTDSDDAVSKQLAVNMVEYLQELLTDHLLQLAGIDHVPSYVSSTTPTIQL